MKNGLTVNKAGTKFWYLNGVLHNESGHAIEWADGDKYWYLNGLKHRVDGPAVELANDGSKFWYLHDKQVIRPEEFSTMEEWLLHLNNNEEYSYQFINDIKGLIGVIDNPNDKQKRLHQMRWVL